MSEYKTSYRKFILASGIYGMILIAINFTMASPVLIEISKSVKSTIALTGMILTFMALGFIFGTVLNGIFTRFIKRKHLYRTVLFVQSLSFMIFAFSKNLVLSLIMFLMLGICCGILEVAIGTMMVELSKKTAGLTLNLVHVFFGIGAIAGPALSSQIVGHGFSWQIGFLFVSGLVFVNFIFSLFIKIPSAEEYDNRQLILNSNAVKSSSPKIVSNFTKLTIGLIILLSVIIFTNTATEVGFTSWMPTFMRLNKGFSNVLAGQSLSLFWLAMLVGRLLVGLLSRWFKIEIILIFLCIACFISAISSVLVKNSAAVFVLFVFVGLTQSGMWPGVLALGSSCFPKNVNLVISVLSAAGGIGGLVSSFIVSLIYYRFDNLKSGLIISSSYVLIAFIVLSIFSLISNREKGSEKAIMKLKK